MSQFPRLFVLPLLSIALLASLPSLSAAQSVQSIVDEMKARHEKQLAAVDNYVVETNFSTSYHRKVTKDGRSTYEVTTRLTGDSQMIDAMGTSPTMTTVGPAYLDRLAKHATYAGTETINGTRTHLLRIDNPEAVFEEMDDSADVMTYYVDAQEYLPLRMVVTMKPDDKQKASTMTIDLRDYRTVKGLTLPYTMETKMDLGLSEETRQQMEQLKKQMEQMPKEQREQMKRMMGDQFEQMQNMMAGEPTVVTVKSVRVNEGIPAGIFSDASKSQ